MNFHILLFSSKFIPQRRPPSCNWAQFELNNRAFWFYEHFLFVLWVNQKFHRIYFCLGHPFQNLHTVYMLLPYAFAIFCVYQWVIPCIIERLTMLAISG